MKVLMVGQKTKFSKVLFLGKSHVVFDPIASGDFDAVVNVRLAKGFTPSSDVQCSLHIFSSNFR
ncbi:hypothetical protein CJ230_09140 [Oligella urethralis]|nr:hypothetical protein CJ230_09140 [Oligella urethralis]